MALCWFYYEALKARRDVHVHARYMIGTMLLLLGPIYARLLMIPMFIAMGDSLPPETIFLYALALTQVLLCIFTLALFFLATIKGRRPAVMIAAVMLVLLAAFFLGRLSDPWRETFIAMGDVSPIPWVATGFLAGAAAAWFGWQAGKRGAASRRVASDVSVMSYF